MEENVINIATSNCKKTNYKNAVFYKLKNRRVGVIIGKERMYCIFKTVDNNYDAENWNLIEVLKNKVVINTIPLSFESAELLFYALGEMILKHKTNNK